MVPTAGSSSRAGRRGGGGGGVRERALGRGNEGQEGLHGERRTLELLVRLADGLAVGLLAPVVAVAAEEAAVTSVKQEQLAACARERCVASNGGRGKEAAGAGAEAA